MVKIKLLLKFDKLKDISRSNINVFSNLSRIYMSRVRVGTGKARQEEHALKRP